MVNGNGNSLLHRRTLDRQIDATIASIRRARNTLYAGMVITFVTAVAMYNASIGWHKSQIERRAMLVWVVNKDWETLDSITTKNKEKEWDFLRKAFIDKKGELGYLSNFLSKNDKDSLMWKVLRENSAKDLDAYVKRGVQFDTIALPFIGVSIAASDIGFIGGLAVTIIGFWLLAAIRRENYALQEFIKFNPQTRNYELNPNNSEDESRYAFKSIVHYMVFIQEQKYSTLSRITILAFALPPLLFLLNNGISIYDICVKGLGFWAARPFIFELVGLILVCFTWISALLYQLDTLHVLQAWPGLIKSPQPKEKSQ